MSIDGRLATLRYKPFRYNTKSRYVTGVYKRTEDVTVHNNRSGTIIDIYIIIDIDNTRMLLSVCQGNLLVKEPPGA